jgi:D-alanyl-D-alanine carboxypeptidase/D-alanyl-D-alanine-endopeptidase (penicillin-binding protein 4)
VSLVSTVLAAVPASAGTAAVALSASASIVELGEPVTLTVALTDDAACLDDRAVTLEWRPADSAGFATVGSSTTSPAGEATFVQAQPHTGRYRASVAPSGGCPAATSAETLVRVRIRVDASVVVGSSEAGTCVTVVAEVLPPRAGQVVELQRRLAGSWTTIEELVLGDTSGTSAEPCFGFDDIGVVRLRVRWVAQDPLNETGSSPTLGFQIVEAPWMAAIDEAIGRRSVSVAVGEEDEFLYRHDDATARIPASNTKLLLAMALLDAFAPSFRMRTSAAVTGIDENGVVEDVWILGRGDPRLGKAGLAALARRLADAGVTRIRGSVLGSTGYFLRDWYAPGWNEVARDYVNRPTALTFEGNDVAHPERRAAEVLTARLEELGIGVRGEPQAGEPPAGLQTLAFVRSQPLALLLRKMLRPSDNFAAEVLGKRLGVERAGVPGSIAKAAAAIDAFADAVGVDVETHDASGLSYDNRVTAQGVVRLLWVAEDAPWYQKLRAALPTGGQGTLRHRLDGVPVRAKTGSLSEVSALSGWVSSGGSWIEFSILSAGMDKARAAAIEDRIVRILAEELD